MFCFIVSCFFSLCAGGLLVEYSNLSGPVTIIGIGTPPQPTRVALCFQSTETMMFLETICPITSCFDPRTSQSSTQLRYMSHSLPMFGLKAHRLISESFTLGTAAPFTHRYLEIDTMVPSTANYKDVAGVLNLGKVSPFMIAQVVSITGSPAGDSFTLRQEVSDSLPDNLRWTGMTDMNAPGYTFQVSSLSIGDISVNENIAVNYNPGLRIMKVPPSVLDMLRTHIGTLNSVFNCESVTSADFVLQLANGPVSIGWNQLIKPLDSADCELRVSTTRSDKIYIGSQLTHSVDSIWLDHRQNRFGIMVTAKFPVPQYTASRSLVPIFNAARIVPSETGLVIEFYQSPQGGRLMVQASKHAIDNPFVAFPHARMWSFVCLSPRNTTESRMDRIGGSNDRFVWAGQPQYYAGINVLRFEFHRLTGQTQANKKYQLFLERGPRSIGVVLAEDIYAESVTIEDMDIPALEIIPITTTVEPGTVDTKSKFSASEDSTIVGLIEPDGQADSSKDPIGEESECSICLREYEGGNIRQRLHCSHAFHFECIRQWIERGRWNCPLCRTEVGLK